MPIPGPELVQQIDWLAIAPPLVLACAAVLVLLADAFVGTPDRPSLLTTWLTVLAVLGAAVPAGVLWLEPRSTFCLVDPGGGPTPCSFVADPLTVAFWAVVLFGTLVVALLGAAAVVSGETPPGEWNFLLLCSATGALTIAAARDLVTLVVALELVSLPAFALVALRAVDARASEASVKFFLVSVVSTAVTLMGISLLYGATGSVFLADLDTALRDGVGPAQVAVAGAVLTIVGLAFKVAAVPFHMWVPDTYVGAPVAVAAYLSVVSKAAGFVGLILVLAVGLPSLAGAWSPVMAVLAALTMTLGNVLALWQQHAVRLLAWSSVAQAGYILVPFGALAALADDPAVVEETLGASIGYLAIYAVINLAAFAVAVAVGASRPQQRLADYRNLVREHPVWGWSLAFALVALAGLPPGIVGLFAKVVVFSAAAGPVTWLAVVMAVNVAVGLVYYARWLAELFRPAETAARPSYPVPGVVGLAIGLTFVAGVVLSVLPGLVLDPAFRLF